LCMLNGFALARPFCWTIYFPSKGGADDHRHNANMGMGARRREWSC